MQLPNKIQNLISLKKILKIPDFIYINYHSFFYNKEKSIKYIQKKFSKNIIIRSASFYEDEKKSNAGKYLSISNIDINNFKKIKFAIENVFKSYKVKHKNQYILIQEYINNAECVGVIFTW